MRLRQSPVVGYLLAGIIIGPFTPGFTGDPARIDALAQVGIIFLLFALGVEFSLEELGRMRRLALLGTALQLGLTMAFGIGLGVFAGWTAAQALYLGALTAISSTIVILKTLLGRRETESTHGRALLGMLIVQDLATVALIVVLPPLTTNGGHLLPTLLIALGKALLFIAATLVLGRRVIPPLLDRVARLGSDELFILATAAIALGAALSATALGLSAALGAFLAGLLVGRSEVEHRALAEVIPLRDLFTSLFFVSVGMLIDLGYVWTHVGLVLAFAAAVLVGKAVIASAVTLLPVFRLSTRTALFVGLGLAQTGEFSYVLARQGLAEQVLVADQYSLVLATSVLTLVATPALFGVVPRLDRALTSLPLLRQLFRPRARRVGPDQADGDDIWLDHVVIVGCGRSGRRVARALHARGEQVIGVDLDMATVEHLHQEGIEALYGDARYPSVLDAAEVGRARALVVALPDVGAARVAVRYARAIRPDLPVIVRAQSQAVAASLREAGASVTVEPEIEGGLALLDSTLRIVGVADDERQVLIGRARRTEQTVA